MVLDSRYTSDFYSGSSFRIYDAVTGAHLGSAGPFGSLEEGGRVRSYMNPGARSLPPRISIAAISRDGSTRLCFININSQTKQK